MQVNLRAEGLHDQLPCLCTVLKDDTVLLWPGETVRWFTDFSHGFEGEQLYMFHCHILEHETAMMVNLKVV